MENEKQCSRCHSAYTVEQIGSVIQGEKVHVCGTCGFTFTESGKALIDDPKELKDINPIAKASEEILQGDPSFQSLSPALKATLRASITSMLTQQWFDGYKHGVLAHALEEEYFKRQGEINDRK